MHNSSFNRKFLLLPQCTKPEQFIESQLLKNKLIQGNSKKYATFHKVKKDDETVSKRC